jgi:hypothetical protein
MPHFSIKKCLCPPCNGAAHEWDFKALLLSEQRIVLAKTGIKGRKAFGQALEEEDPEAWTALMDILHRRAGIGMRWEEIELDLEEVDVELTDEEKASLSPEELAEIEKAEAEGKGQAAGGDRSPSPGSGTVNGADLTPKWPTTHVNSGAITG